MKKKLYLVGIFIIAICLLLGLSACSLMQERKYYEGKSNYVEAKGTVAYISCNEENKALYIDFSVTEPVFDDTCFKIVGDNYDIVKKNGINNVLKVGSDVTFITAPKCFGDGYVMPIVSISVGEDTFLTFNEGFPNLINWLDS